MTQSSDDSSPTYNYERNQLGKLEMPSRESVRQVAKTIDALKQRPIQIELSEESSIDARDKITHQPRISVSTKSAILSEDPKEVTQPDFDYQPPESVTSVKRSLKKRRKRSACVSECTSKKRRKSSTRKLKTKRKKSTTHTRLVRTLDRKQTSQSFVFERKLKKKNKDENMSDITSIFQKKIKELEDQYQDLVEGKNERERMLLRKQKRDLEKLWKAKMDETNTLQKIQIERLKLEVEELKKNPKSDAKAIRKSIKKEVKGEYLLKVKKFKDETFTELRHLEVENRSIKIENQKLKDRVMELETKLYTHEDKVRPQRKSNECTISKRLEKLEGLINKHHNY